MRPVSGAVLGVAAVLTSPALYAAASGALPLDVALTRFLLAVGVGWVLLSAAAQWVESSQGAAASPAPDPATVASLRSPSPAPGTSAPPSSMPAGVGDGPA